MRRPPQPQQTLRVLVVNDNPYTAGTLVSSIRKELPSGAVVRLATDTRGATDLLNQERYHAVVVSQDLPDGKGIALLKSLLVMPRRPTGLFLINDAATLDTELAQFSRENPQVSLVQKPFRFPVVAGLVRNTLVPSQSTEQSYYGLRLSELIQAFSIGRRSATIQLIMPDNKLAAIFIDKGELIHALYGEEEGKEALGKILLSKKGTVRVEKECPTAKRSILEPTQHVLLDIYRRIDEERWAAATDLEKSPHSPTANFEENLDGIIDGAFDLQSAP